MFFVAMASAAYLAGLQASITAPRMAFTNCLKQAEKSAQVDKVGPDGFGDYLRKTCGPQGDKLKAALIAFDVKNGVGRSRATTDAAADVEDGYSTSAEAYKWRNGEQAQATN